MLRITNGMNGGVTDKTMLPIKIIQESEILTQDIFNDLVGLAGELEHTFNSVQMHRTRTEMEVSVLNDLKHPTPASKYWQSVREQNSMFQGLTTLSFDYRMGKVKAKILKERIENEKHILKKELLQIKLEQKVFALKNMEQSAKARIREIKNWSEIKSREADKMTQIELDSVDNHQLISYTRRWINQIIEMGNSGSPAERQNLIGQLQAGIKLCDKKNVLGQVLTVYNKNIQDQVIDIKENL